MRYVLILLSLVFAGSAATAQSARQQTPSAGAPSAAPAAKAKPKKVAAKVASKPKKMTKPQPAPSAAPAEPVETEMVPELSERDRVMGGRN